MAENTRIEWADMTFNPWIGCTRISPGCDHCYAEAHASRFGTAEWGPGKPRYIYWRPRRRCLSSCRMSIVGCTGWSRR